MRTRGAALVALCLIGWIGSASAWMARTGPGYYVFQGVMAVAPSGGVFIDAGWKPRPFVRGIAIEAWSRSGVRRWRHRLAGSPGGDATAYALAATSNGDVVAAGSWERRVQRFLVFRMAGSDGHLQWRYELAGRAPDPTDQAAIAVAVDPAGAVIAAGRLSDGPDFLHPDDSLAVVKLEGGSGIERWRYLRKDPGTPGYAGASRMAVDAHGDVIVTGGWSSGPVGSVGG